MWLLRPLLGEMSSALRRSTHRQTARRPVALAADTGERPFKKMIESHSQGHAVPMVRAEDGMERAANEMALQVVGLEGSVREVRTEGVFSSEKFKTKVDVIFK